ncbi:DUF2752 domain-containing protein [Actinomadura roseirufa]|uniref:DUF2752 domain-containing protein n=1 Tax=Actinomadura roseirufa TaxID=2094049 RepID=UPI0013F15632|nr:DUF2752 domain-containing protein [Actinomadura roseirufa]
MTHDHGSARLRPGGPSRPASGPGRRRGGRGAAARLLAPAGVLVLAVSVVSYVAVVDPNQHGHYPTCPFLALTGLQCPGCGSLRMIHALAHGRPREALGLNVFAVSMLPVLAFFWVRWTAARARDRPTRTKPGDPRLIWALFTGIVLFWLLRNLPFGSGLAA